MAKAKGAKYGGHGVGFKDLNRQRLSEDAELRWEFEAERQRIAVALSLQQLQQDAGLGQAEMARLSGTTQPMLSRFFSCEDDRSPNIETLVKLADAVQKRLSIQFVDLDAVVDFEWSKAAPPTESEGPRWALAAPYTKYTVSSAASAVRSARRFCVVPAADAAGEAATL